MCVLENGLALMAINLFIIGTKTELMSSKKGDILFAVGALSDVYFECDEDICTYTQVIEDFVDSEMEGDMDNECG